jgi:hypothetical protein
MFGPTEGGTNALSPSILTPARARSFARPAGAGETRRVHPSARAPSSPLDDARARSALADCSALSPLERGPLYFSVRPHLACEDVRTCRRPPPVASGAVICVPARCRCGRCGPVPPLVWRCAAVQADRERPAWSGKFFTSSFLPAALVGRRGRGSVDKCVSNLSILTRRTPDDA